MAESGQIGVRRRRSAARKTGGRGGMRALAPVGSDVGANGPVAASVRSPVDDL